MSQQPAKPKRQRGRLLTDKGWEKLKDAISRYEDEKNVRLTNEKISEIAKLENSDTLGVSTISKIKNRQEGVELSSLRKIFRVFQLELEDDDWYRIENSQPDSQSPPIDRDFYVKRSLIEDSCYTEILQRGGLLRIQAPWHMGKSRFMSVILQRAKQQGNLTIVVKFGNLKPKHLSNIDIFFRWFCNAIVKELQRLKLELDIPSNQASYWDDTFDSKFSCRDFFEKNLLSKISKTFILGIDDVDLVYGNPNIADDFFDLLRDWNEETKDNDDWSKLRFILTYSRRNLRISSLNQSPFNSGFYISLEEYTAEEILNFSKQYGLVDWKIDREVRQLMKVVGGHPFLVETALKNISRKCKTLEEIIETASSPQGIYSRYLDDIWNKLHKHDENNKDKKDLSLKTTMQRVVNANETESIRLTEEEKLHLYRMGLVIERDYCAFPRCELYRQYFKKRLMFE